MESGTSEVSSPTSSSNVSRLRGWRFWIKPVVIVVYSATLLVGLPFLCIDLYRNQANPHQYAYFVAALFLAMTIPISLWTMVNHLIYFTQPDLQKPILRILWMVPIYAIDSWFAVKFPPAAIYLDTFRECYEAYVIYNFMAYILNYLTQKYELGGTIRSKPQVRHLFPFCFLPHWEMGDLYIQRCQQGVLQYTLIRPITTIVSFICEIAGSYHEGEFDFKYAWLWILIINNLSQVWALYSLMMLYQATAEELKPLKPIGKFICVKMVVFASFWQGVVIAVVVALIDLDTAWGWNSKTELANSLQDLLICFEMFIAAIAHHYTFTHEPYMLTSHNIPWYRSIHDMFDVSDVTNDVSHQVRRTVEEGRQKAPWRQKKKKSAAGRPSPQQQDDDPLIDVDETSRLLSNSSPSSQQLTEDNIPDLKYDSDEDPK